MPIASSQVFYYLPPDRAANHCGRREIGQMPYLPAKSPAEIGLIE